MQQQIYNLIFRRNSVFVPTIFIGAFAFSIGFDQITSEFWDKHNKGVSSRRGKVDRSGSGRRRHRAERLSAVHADPLSACNSSGQANTSQKQWKDIRAKYVQADEDDE